MKFLFALFTLTMTTSFYASATTKICSKEAQRAAIAKYVAMNGTVQGSERSSEAILLKQSKDAELYQIDIKDSNDEGESWISVYDVEIKTVNSRCQTIRVTHMPLKELEIELVDQIAYLVHTSQVMDLTSNDKLKLQTYKVFDILKSTITNKNYVTLYIGEKNHRLSTPAFITSMEKHIQDVRDVFSPYGLLGYQVYMTAQHEVAYQVWSSKEDAEAAFASAEAKVIFDEAQNILTTKIFKDVTH